MDGPRNHGMLIAETDENGNVACVWIKHGKNQVPRPIRRGAPGEPLQGFNQLSVTGAPREAILAWLDEGR